MDLMDNRRTKQGHDAIAHDLVDGAFIAMHGGHHAFQYRIEELPDFLRVTISEQFHRALQVSEEHCDLFALAFEGTAGGEDLLRKIGWRVGEGRRHRSPCWC